MSEVAHPLLSQSQLLWLRYLQVTDHSSRPKIIMLERVYINHLILYACRQEGYTNYRVRSFNIRYLSPNTQAV